MKQFFRILFKEIKLFIKHYNHIKLYDDVWKRPDGVCVNDENKKWDKYWQKIEE